MSSTITHSFLATMVAITTNEAPLPVKAVVLGGLILSHGLLDAIPHLHLYSFAALKIKTHFFKNVLGAVIELGGGLIVLPILFSTCCRQPVGWLMACVLAASFFDVAVASGNKWFSQMNHRFHWWNDGRISLVWKMMGELVTLLIIVDIALFAMIS